MGSLSDSALVTCERLSNGLGIQRCLKLQWQFALLGYRVGEAKNPGPKETDDETFVLGTANPTGLMHKASLISTLPQGNAGNIYAISETHLTVPGTSQFQRELSVCKSPFKLYRGAPVQSKVASHSSIGGKQKGVAFLSTIPGRALTCTWDETKWAEGRFHLSAFCIGHEWILGGVAYGYATMAQTIPVRQQTETILKQLTHRIVEQGEGPRFIAGDFNQDPDILEEPKVWQSKGWKEAQEVFFEMTGKYPEITCKHRTRKDYLWLSPELCRQLLRVEVLHDSFKDHAVIVAEFQAFRSSSKIPVWRKPLPLPWKLPAQKAGDITNIDPAELDQSEFCPTSASPNEQVIEIMGELERRVVQAAGDRMSLTEGQLGRGKTLDVTWIPAQSGLLKQSRPGDIRPQFHGQHATHIRWFKQLRRLVAYVQLLQTTRPITPSWWEQRSRLWQAVLHASGFAPNFQKWWIRRVHDGAHVPQMGNGRNEQAYHAPDAIPVVPPGHATALAIQTVMQREVDALERALNARRRQFVKDAHKEDVNRVFRDLRDDNPKPVQCLVRRTHYQVVEVSGQSITTAPEVDPTHRVLVHPEGQVKVALHDGPRIEPVAPIDVQKGDSLMHEQDVGEVTQVMAEFASEWAKRWDRHRHTPDEQWQPVLNFISSSLPRGEIMSDAPITIEQWMHAVHQKKRSAATGPDGLSRADLVAMPVSLHRCLVKVLNAIEDDPAVQWPEQWLEGHVFALEKVEGAQEVGSFRPITIFSIAYRTWSSLRSKQLLRHLCQFAATTCFGNLPRRHTSQVWWMLQETLEHASHNDQRLSGAVMDVVKAFNHLPRMVLLETACHLQVAPGLIRGWAKALTGLQRRFMCRGCAGEPQASTTGFPEGCGLSVCAMLLANIVGHTWAEVHEPQASFISYVDNYEVVASGAGQTLQAMQAIHDFASQMDIQIDESKTFAWATETHTRAELRQHGLDVKGAARELGGHLQYTRAFTNFTLQKRLSRMPMVWTRMARSSAGYWRKLKAIRAKAWPKALHGAETVELGVKHFNQLRTGALRGLGVHKLGTSPIGHLSLLERADADPYCYLIVRMLCLFRAEQRPERTGPILDDLSSGDHPQWRAGPCSVLLKRLRDLGWNWTGGGNWRDDQNLPCRLFDCPIQELRERITRSWQTKVQMKLRRRKTFQGIEDSCPQLSTGQIQLWSADEQGILRAAMNGTFYTQDKHQGDSNHCRFCGHTPDGQFHRLWECEAFDAQRMKLGPRFRNCRSLLRCMGGSLGHGPTSILKMHYSVSQTPQTM